jgi:hypothetical protein
MGNKSLIALIAAVVLAVVAWNSFYIVSQTERAVLLQFGRVVQADVQPGLHVKVPYVNQVRKFDARLMTLDAPTQRFLTLEKKAVMVDAYAKWRVKDAERFYTATSGLKQIADDRLSRRLESGLRDQFGKRTLHEVVSGQRDELMAGITESLNKMANDELGIQVLDVRVKAIDLPKEVNRSVFERMSTERERASTGPRVTSWQKAFVPMPIASVGCCWPRLIASRKRPAVRGMRRQLPSTPRPTVRIRSSTTSTVACRLIARASRAKAMCWSSIRTVTSSSTWRSSSRDPRDPAQQLKRRAG